MIFDAVKFIEMLGSGQLQQSLVSHRRCALSRFIQMQILIYCKIQLENFGINSRPMVILLKSLSCCYNNCFVRCNGL